MLFVLFSCVNFVISLPLIFFCIALPIFKPSFTIRVIFVWLYKVIESVLILVPKEG
jgi:hypothetical protein